MALHGTPLSGRPLWPALKAWLRCSLAWCLAAISVGAGRQKTAFGLARVLTAANREFRSRGNPAYSSGGFRAFGVLVPGAMGRAGARYRESAFSIGCQYKTTGNRPLTSRSTGRQKRGAFGPLRFAAAPVTSALKAWLRRSWVWCLVTGCQLSSGRTQPSVWRRFSRPIRCLGRGAIRRKHRAVSACSVFWFLAPWVALVQSIGSRHSALGAAINCRAAPASNQSQQFVAYGHRTPLSGRRCASALAIEYKKHTMC